MIEEQTPTFQTVIAGAIKSARRNDRQAIPARVEAYDAAKRKITATPLILEAYVDDAGERKTERLQSITNVPVIFPGGGKTFIRWPISVGDVVLLIVSSTSLDLWLQRGGFVDPADDRRNDINDCFAIPGLSDFAHAADNGFLIEFTENEIRAGGGAQLATKADLDALISIFNSHTHLTAGTGSPTPPSAGTVPPVGLAPNSVGTQILKGS